MDYLSRSPSTNLILPTRCTTTSSSSSIGRLLFSAAGVLRLVAVIHVHPHDYSCKRDMQERVVAMECVRGEEVKVYVFSSCWEWITFFMLSFTRSFSFGSPEGCVYVCEQGSNALSFFSFTSFSLSSQYPCPLALFPSLSREPTPSFPPIQHRQLQASTPYHANTSMMDCVFGLVIDVAHSVTKKSLEWDRWWTCIILVDAA